jgi:peroxiredoxin
MKFLMLIFPLAAMISGHAFAETQTLVGKTAPGFTLRDKDGALLSLSDMAYSGPEKVNRPRQVVLLDFFSTSCKPCIKSLPALIELYKKFTGKGVKMIMVALLEEEEGQEKLDRFLKEHPLPFTVLIDPYQAAGKKYVEQRGAVQIPALFVIDQTGVIRGQIKGASDDELPKLTRLIQGLL